MAGFTPCRRHPQPAAPCWAAREASVDDASVGVYPIGRVLRKVMGVWPAWLAVLYTHASFICPIVSISGGWNPRFGGRGPRPVRKIDDAGRDDRSLSTARAPVGGRLQWEAGWPALDIISSEPGRRGSARTACFYLDPRFFTSRS